MPSLNIEHDGAIRVRWSIKWKLMLLIASLIVSLMLILTTVQISSQTAVLQRELSKRSRLMRDSLIERGQSLANALARQVENDLAAFNLSAMFQRVSDSVGKNDLKYAILMDASGMAVAHTRHPDLAQTMLTSPRDRAALEQTAIALFEYNEEGGNVIEIVSPIQFSTAPWGVLRLVFTLQHLEEEIRASDAQIKQEIRRMMARAMLTALAFIAAAFALSAMLSATVSRPLIELTRAAKSLSRGDFAASTQLRIASQDEIGVLASSFIEMSRDLKASYEQLEEYSRTLEQKVEERTRELHQSLRHVEAANHKIMESIRYATLIQHALLPEMAALKARLPHSFFLWLPRDVVGGDVYFAEFYEDRLMLALMDCTGHGVPGAFMTMIASSALSRIVKDERCCDPAETLRRLNQIVKSVLHQDQTTTLSDNGLDAAICTINFTQKTLTFAGARLSLFVTQPDGAHHLKGDRQSIGYKRSPVDAAFTNHAIAVEHDMMFYLVTDGYIDQIGGASVSRFGTQRFESLLLDLRGMPIDEQQERLLAALRDHQGAYERLDDVTLIGFHLNHLFVEEDSKNALVSKNERFN